jgi:hypothetical protein
VFYVEKNKNKLFSKEFVNMIFTDINGDKYYTTFLKFNELTLKDGSDSLITPKAICLISNEPIFECQQKILTLIYKNVIFKNNVRSLTAFYGDPMSHLLSVEMEVQIEIKEDIMMYLQHQLEFYISMCFHYLHMPTNYLNMEMLWEDNMVVKYQNIAGTENLFAVENFTYELLLRRIRPYRILQLVSAILQERPIFLVDDEIDDMAIIIKSLLSLVKPLTWMNGIVPIIAAEFSDIIGSPMGIIVGIHSEIWKKHCQNKVDDFLTKYSYVLFINNDTNICDIEPIPIPDQESIEKFFYYFINILEYPEEDHRMKDDWKKIMKQIGVERELTTEDYLRIAQLKIDQELFLKIFVKNLKNLNLYTHFDQDAQTFLNNTGKINIFDSEAFLESWLEERREFLKSMFNTQIFSGFMDKAFKVHNNLLGKDEHDTEKIWYFFKSLSFLEKKSPKEIRKIMAILYDLPSWKSHKKHL